MILKVCRYPVETLKSNVELSEFLYEYHYTLFKSFCKGYLEKEKKKIIPSYPNNKKSVCFKKNHLFQRILFVQFVFESKNVFL